MFSWLPAFVKSAVGRFGNTQSIANESWMKLTVYGLHAISIPFFHYTFFHPFQYTHMKPLFTKFFRLNSNDRSQMPAHDDSSVMIHPKRVVLAKFENWHFSILHSNFEILSICFDACVRLPTIPIKFNILSENVFLHIHPFAFHFHIFTMNFFNVFEILNLVR